MVTNESTIMFLLIQIQIVNFKRNKWGTHCLKIGNPPPQAFFGDRITHTQNQISKHEFQKVTPKFSKSF